MRMSLEDIFLSLTTEEADSPGGELAPPSGDDLSPSPEDTVNA
jgi:hypothetical protein